MSDETTGQDQGQSGPRGKSPKVELLTVGHFVHRDHILGGEYDRFGVVTAVGDGVLTVRPLAEHTVQLDAAEFTPLSPDDLA